MEQISTRACNVYTIRSPGRDAWTLCSSWFCASSWQPMCKCAKCFETKLQMKKKGTLFKSFGYCWELIGFSYFNNSGGDFMLSPPHRCLKVAFSKWMRREMLPGCFKSPVDPSWTNLCGNVLILIMNFTLSLTFHPSCRCGWHLDLFVLNLSALIPWTASWLRVLLHRTTKHPAAEPTCRERRQFIDFCERQPSRSVRCLPEIQRGKLGVALHMGSVKCGLSLWEVESEVFGYLAAAEADCCIDFT